MTCPFDLPDACLLLLLSTFIFTVLNPNEELWLHPSTEALTPSAPGQPLCCIPGNCSKITFYLVPNLMPLTLPCCPNALNIV